MTAIAFGHGYRAAEIILLKIEIAIGVRCSTDFGAHAVSVDGGLSGVERVSRPGVAAHHGRALNRMPL